MNTTPSLEEILRDLEADIAAKELIYQEQQRTFDPSKEKSMPYKQVGNQIVELPY